MLRSPPPQKGAPAIVPRTFLRRTDPCFEQLRSRDQATEDLMKIDKLIPGALNAISSMASNPRSPGPPNPTPTPPPGGGGGGAGGGGKGKGKGKGANKRNADGSAKADVPPSSPPGDKPPLARGQFAAQCSWSAQVLTIKREYADKKSGKLITMPACVFDVGKFCAANGIAFIDYCWEFVCSYWLSTFDRANRKFFDGDAKSTAKALRIACARCSHSSDTSNHPDALSAKHSLPNHMAKMLTYFRQG